MIRLPPTTIVLGRSDLTEFDHRQLRHWEEEVLNKEYSCIAVGASDGPQFAALQIQPSQGVGHEGELRKLRTGDAQNASCGSRPLTLQTSVPKSSTQIARGAEDKEFGALTSPESLITTEDACSSIAELQDEHDYVCVGSENSARDSQLSLSLSKDDFYYSGFVECPSEHTSHSIPDRSSSFGMLLTSKDATFLTYCIAPDDISTPQSIRLPEASIIRNRAPLPRSPLFLSHNASSSPEQRPTSSLTPRVASRIATHKTPGLMFAQPARRMRRRSPRTFRHQTNSFSFDSSERASAAYEQDRVSSTSTNDTAPQPSDDLSLHEELRGSSLQSSRVSSGISHALPDPLVEGLSTVRIRDESDEVVSNDRDFIFSSPRLLLPPPFSTISRSVSEARSLPRAKYVSHNPPTSPIRTIRSKSYSLSSNQVEGRRSNPHFNPTALEHVGKVDSSPPVRHSPQFSQVKC
jgi:hypothetical protein